jgi:hypothetical protein
MLKINSNTDAPRLVFDVVSMEESTQQEDIYNTTLDEAISNSINPIFDNEVTEFKPEGAAVNFYMFFSAFKNLDWFENVKPYLEDSFAFHLEDSKTSLTTEARNYITDPKLVLQSTGIPAPKPQFWFHIKPLERLLEIPYVVLDPVYQLTVSLPSKEGLPVFYNSFALPFANNLSKWSDDVLGFSNKSFLYNSFMMMEFFTTNNVLTQKKVMSIPVYVNGRYMIHEENTLSVKQIRPAMSLSNNTEGFSVVWLKQHNIEKLYVKFSFWDALNGQQLTFLPSSDVSVQKKWVQNPNTFKQENLYLEYTFNYTTKTYSISEFNEVSGLYDIKSTTFDMYQLLYDEYFARLTRVGNVRPVEEEVVSDGIEGEDINLFTSIASLDRLVSASFNDPSPVYNMLQAQWGRQPKGIFQKAMYGLFNERKLAIKDQALLYFERRFQIDGSYNQDLGSVILTNNTDTHYRLKTMQVLNVQVQNKNNFFDGDPIVVNKFTRSNATSNPSGYALDTYFTFQGSKFFNKVNPLKNQFDQANAALSGDDTSTYNGYYYDEANNKVVEKPPVELNNAIDGMDSKNRIKLFGDILTRGSGIFGFIRNARQYEQKVKGLTLNEKDLNLLLRNDILEQSGGKAKYELYFPATTEKLAKKTADFTDFCINIKNTLTPHYEDFGNGMSMILNTDVLLGKEFFKLFIATEDTLTISFDVLLQFMDKNGTLYKKVIPCSIRYI